MFGTDVLFLQMLCRHMRCWQDQLSATERRLPDDAVLLRWIVGSIVQKSRKSRGSAFNTVPIPRILAVELVDLVKQYFDVCLFRLSFAPMYIAQNLLESNHAQILRSTSVITLM